MLQHDAPLTSASLLLRAAVDEGVDALGGLHVVVSNAGIPA
jgi:NAD(P)-dependent dehydrogenase (short-subunit alcohol dehydrogenase family)